MRQSVVAHVATQAAALCMLLAVVAATQSRATPVVGATQGGAMRRILATSESQDGEDVDKTLFLSSTTSTIEAGVTEKQEQGAEYFAVSTSKPSLLA